MRKNHLGKTAALAKGDTPEKRAASRHSRQHSTFCWGKGTSASKGDRGGDQQHPLCYFSIVPPNIPNHPQQTHSLLAAILHESQKTMFYVFILLSFCLWLNNNMSKNKGSSSHFRFVNTKCVPGTVLSLSTQVTPQNQSK